MHHLKRSVPSTFLIILLTGFPLISETIYTPALPEIAQSLKTTNTLAQWTLSVYFFGFALGVFYWGRLSDRIGRRPSMLLGIALYSLSTLSCMLSPSINWLLISRIVQAFGASVGSVIVLTIMREAFADKARFKLFALVTIALSIAPALGPFLGGYISQWFGWRANFAFLLAMSLSLILYSFFTLPETKPALPPGQKLVSTHKIALQFLKDGKVLACIWIVGALNGLLFSYYAEAPFIFIQLIGLNPEHYGLLGIFIAVASLLGATLSHQLSNFYTSKQLISIGVIIMFANISLLNIFAIAGWIDAAHIIRSILLIMLPIAGTVGCFGIVIPAILSNALDNYKAILGTAGALFGLSYWMLTAACIGLMGILHTGTIIPMPLYFLFLTSSILLTYYFVLRKIR